MTQLLLRPDLGLRAYCLSYRFRIGAFPSAALLERTKYAEAERFERIMAKQGWDYVDKYGFHMRGPFVPIDPTGIPKRPPHLTAREMLPAVRQGARFLAPKDYGVQTLPILSETEKWEYELRAVFVGKTIVFEYPELHEERN